MNTTIYQTLLISEDTIKSNTTISDNLEGKVLYSTIQRVQDIKLQAIIGTELYRGLQERIANNTLTDADKYLLDVFIQPFLLESIIADLYFESAGQLHNAGLIQPNDQHYYQVDRDNRLTLQEQHLNYADQYKKLMQQYLSENQTLYPELEGSDLDYLYPEQLYSAADCPIWLGGVVGKK